MVFALLMLLKGGVNHLHIFRKSFNDKVTVLQGLAVARDPGEEWKCIVAPWLEQAGISIVKANHVSEP